MSSHPEDAVLVNYAAGALPAAGRRKVDAHLPGCASCRQFVASCTERTDASGERLVLDAPVERTRELDPLIGQLLGEYRVLARLGEGGMGIVYRGEQPVIGKAVAIKVLLHEDPNDPTLVERLLGEARAVNAVRHPNIIDIFAFGQLPDGRHYMVMELLEGKPLSSLLQQGPLPVAQVLVVLAQAMAALEAAHAAGVIHRDLKPDNIFVNPRADGWIVTLLDFGLAKRKGSEHLTSPGMVMGTPDYMAPEQVRGREATAQTDVYAMGVVAWTLLVGRVPFGGATVLDVMRAQVSQPAPPLAEQVRGLPPALVSLVTRMLAKEPEQRPTTTEVREAVAKLTPRPGAQQPAAAAELVVPLNARRALWGVGALVVVALAVGGWELFGSAEPPPDVAPHPLAGPPPGLIIHPPVAAPPPRVAEVTVDAGAAPEVVVPPRGPSTRKSWRCAAVTRVSELTTTWGGAYDLFDVAFGKGPSLIISVSSRDPDGKKPLEEARKEIAACRKSQGWIVGAETNEQPQTFTPAGVFAGTNVDVHQFSVEKDPSPKPPR